MAKVERFEDLVAWQKARVLRKAVREMTGDLRFKTEFALRDQIRRAATSVMSNIAEGFERGSRAEFARFLAMSKASCGEVRSLLYAALDDELIDRPAFERIYARPMRSQEWSAAFGQSSQSNETPTARSNTLPFGFSLLPHEGERTRRTKK